MRKTSALLLILIPAVITFVLTPVLWHPAEEIGPTAAQLPFFLFIGVLDSLLFGLGVFFAVRGFSLLRQWADSQRAWAGAAYVSICWMLVSWWPHSNAHISIRHDDFQSLLFIEYGFHVSLYIAGAIVAVFFLKVLSTATPMKMEKRAAS